MKNFFLPAAEKLINTYLNYDAEIASRLESQNNKIVLIELTDLKFSFSVLIEEKKIILSSFPSPVFSTKIKGRSFSFLRLLLNKGPVNSVLHESRIEIEGDIFFLQVLQDVFSNIDVNWEEFLHPYLGHVVSRYVGKTMRGAKEITHKNGELFIKNLSLYLQEELKLLPPSEEIRDWYDDVSSLRNDVERLEARINLL